MLNNLTRHINTYQTNLRLLPCIRKLKVKAVRTTSVQSALQSLGGIQLLYLLLEQLDYNFEDAIESGATMEPFPVFKMNPAGKVVIGVR
nr:hypothetical transcript [Hymenolepis microstoma]